MLPLSAARNWRQATCQAGEPPSSASRSRGARGFSSAANLSLSLSEAPDAICVNTTVMCVTLCCEIWFLLPDLAFLTVERNAISAIKLDGTISFSTACEKARSWKIDRSQSDQSKVRSAPQYLAWKRDFPMASSRGAPTTVERPPMRTSLSLGEPDGFW